MKLSVNIVFLIFVIPTVLLIFSDGSKLLARAEDDDDVDVEGEENEPVATTEGEEEEGEIPGPGPSPDAETTILFTKPIATTNLELPAGNLVEFLVGFSNKGKQEFVLETLEASFRYPQDFSFYIQNFSTLVYNRQVKAGHEATLAYSFVPAEASAGRPFGLNILLNYKDEAGNLFREAVFNETIQIVDVEEGLDGETFFLYIFLAACGVLLLVVGQHFLVSVGRKRGHVARKPLVETGTKSNPNDVDFEWLPKDTLRELNKSQQQQRSPKSPKTKKTRS